MIQQYAYQDGRQFYVFASEADAKSTREDKHELYILEYPWRVQDFDMQAAKQARQWALDLSQERGIELVMVKL